MQAAQAARMQEAAQRSARRGQLPRARAAVDGYLTTVSESQLLKFSGLQPLRGELLESALRFYQDFLKERGDDPGSAPNWPRPSPGSVESRRSLVLPTKRGGP